MVVPLGINITIEKTNFGVNLLPTIRLGNESIRMPNSADHPIVESLKRAALGVEGLIVRSLGKRFKLSAYYKTYLTNSVNRSVEFVTYTFIDRAWGISLSYRFVRKDQKIAQHGVYYMAVIFLP